MTSQIEAAPSSLPASQRILLGVTRWARRNGLQIGIVVVALVIWGFFTIGAPRTFLSYPIYAAFMSTTPFFAMMALPLTLVVIAGEIDLSFPSIMAIGMTVFSAVFVATGSLWLAFFASLTTGALAGLLNGQIVVRLGIPSLVATIGTQFFWRGAVMVLNAGSGTSLVSAKGTLLHSLLVGRLGGRVPAQMLWTIGMALVMWFLLNRHRFGAHVYLVGDNVDSARLMGINVERQKIGVFTLVGVAAALAGMMSSFEVTYFWPTLGEGSLLTTLSSVFLGGTSVFGGTGTIFGTFVAAFIIGAINAGIVAVGISGFWTQLIYGLIIVISVATQAALRRKLE